ncbi:hypothetical protein [Brevifollis gellanilyticus]|uniref:Uncharacterized protein n=1 Tax=Brevifollis gellanilyticus TaxID=748831 RepID=A0A512M9S8_9BACT|nr:hypothetical protein [Brevifollis gellanilyticus]GEP43081.1 hypothetical protein BGE01nite_23720 [Brevifollis gellanilyticus]
MAVDNLRHAYAANHIGSEGASRKASIQPVFIRPTMSLHIQKEIVLNEARLTSAETIADQFHGLLRAGSFNGPTESEIIFVVADLDEKIALLKAAHSQLLTAMLARTEKPRPQSDLQETINQCLTLRIVIRDLTAKLNALGLDLVQEATRVPTSSAKPSVETATPGACESR